MDGLRPDDPPVTDNPSQHRFEIVDDGATAFLLYRRASDSLTIVHTEVPPPLRGRHLGDVLVRAALDSARRDGLKVIAACPFARAYLRKHPIRS